MNRNDFDHYEDLSRYWIAEDALRSLDHDLYFSLGTRYHCDAGCHVCYIKDNLAQTGKIASSLFPNNFHNDMWKNVFEYFGSIRTNDDMHYMKHHLPKQWEWYQENGSNMELCITDNAIFRIQNLDLKIKTLGDVSLSTEFLEKVGVEKVVDTLLDLQEKFGILKIKYIDCGNPDIFEQIIKFTADNDLHSCVHHDFRTDERMLVDDKYTEYQNTWVINDNQGLMQIYRESLHLYYDGFYFSSDDASKIWQNPFYVINDKFNPTELMAKMIIAKQEQYKEWKNRVINKKFRDYYNTTQEFKVNEHFNYIPVTMFPRSSTFFYRLEKDGWVRTNLGMIKPTEEVVSLIEKKV